MVRQKIKLDMEKIIKMYTIENKTLKEIATVFNCHLKTIYNRLRENNITIKNKSFYKGNIPWNRGQTKNSNKIIRRVSDMNKGITWENKLGKERSDELKLAMSERQKGVKNYSYINRGEKHKWWKDGKTITKEGYVGIYCKEHPYSGKDGYMFEHRLVMEKHLGRYLTKDECVHHIDGNRSNNEINNLCLFENQSKHTSHHHFLRVCVKEMIQG